MAIGTQAGPQIFRSTKATETRFKTYLRELIRGDVRPYLGHNGEMEPKGLPMTRETMTRVRIAVLIYSMVNAVLFGAGLIFVLTLPVLSAHAGFWISVVVGASLILAAPIAWWIAPRLRARFGKGKAEGTTTAGQM